MAGRSSDTQGVRAFLTAELEPDEAELLRRAFSVGVGPLEVESLSENGRTIHQLLSNPSVDEAQTALNRIPDTLRDRLLAMSPTSYLNDIRAPLIVLLHDRGDTVVPVGESRRLREMLSGRAGIHYTELQSQHLNPARLPVFRLARELTRFLFALYPLFR